MKKLFEEQISALKRNHEREFNEMMDSFSKEHEDNIELLSGVTRECVDLKDRYV